MQKKLFLIVPLMFLLIGTLAACGDDEEVVATVNGEAIYESEWQQVVDQMTMQYTQMGMDLESEEGSEMLEMIEDQALESLIQQTAVVQYAVDEGTKVNDSDIDGRIDEMIAQYGGESEFEAVLEENDYTMDSFKDYLYDELIIETFLDDYLDDVDVSEEEVKEYYEEYTAQFEDEEEDPEDLEDIEDQIVNQIKQESEQEQIQFIIELAMEDAEIERKI